MFIAAIFTVVKIKRQPQCPPIYKRIKGIYMYTMCVYIYIYCAYVCIYIYRCL